MKRFTFLRRGDRGAALVEYGILVGLVAVVAIGSVSGLGRKVSATFDGTSEALSQTTIAAGAGAENGAPGDAGEQEQVADFYLALIQGSEANRHGYDSTHDPAYGSFERRGYDGAALLKFIYVKSSDNLWMAFEGDQMDFLQGKVVDCPDIKRSFTFDEADYLQVNGAQTDAIFFEIGGYDRSLPGTSCTLD